MIVLCLQPDEVRIVLASLDIGIKNFENKTDENYEQYREVTQKLKEVHTKIADTHNKAIALLQEEIKKGGV